MQQWKRAGGDTKALKDMLDRDVFLPDDGYGVDDDLARQLLTAQFADREGSLPLNVSLEHIKAAEIMGSGVGDKIDFAAGLPLGAAHV